MSGLEVQHVTPKYPAYHAIKTLPSMPYCCWYRLGYPDEACKFRFPHLGAAFYPLACSGFFGCQVPCSPNTQDLVARVRAMRTSISYQRIHRPYLGIFSEICLFSMLLSLFNFKMYYTYLILEIVFQSPLLFCGSFSWP